MIVLSLLAALAGLGVLVVALLVSHQTPLPPMRRPGMLWWTAIGLFLMSLVLLIAPAMVRYTGCENICVAAAEGGESTHDFSAGVESDYASCASNTLAEVRRKVAQRNQEGANLDVEAEVAAAKAGAEEVCMNLAQGRCISACYRPPERL